MDFRAPESPSTEQLQSPSSPPLGSPPLMPTFIESKGKQRQQDTETKDDCLLTDAQRTEFWNQTYAWLFTTAQGPIPNATLRLLGLPTRSWLDEADLDEAEWEDLEDNRTSMQWHARRVQRRIVVERFANMAACYSECVPVDDTVRTQVLELVKDKRAVAALLRMKQAEEETDEKMKTPEQDEDEMIPACNCPYCWYYTEELSDFIDHLCELHVLRQNPKTRMLEPVSVAEVKSVAEEKERKDSGYDEPDAHEIANNKYAELFWSRLEASQGKTQGVAEAASVTEQKVLASQPRPTHWTTSQQDASSVAQKDLKFWRKLTYLPLKSLSCEPARARSGGRAQAHRDERSLKLEDNAQRVRDALKPCFYWDAYEDKISATLGDTRSTEAQTTREDSGPPENKTMPSSSLSQSSAKPLHLDLPKEEPEAEDEDIVMEDAASLPDESRSSLEEDTADILQWFCPHDGSCNQKFSSVVLFMEHLSEKGFIVYKPYEDLFPLKRVQGDMRELACAAGL